MPMGEALDRVFETREPVVDSDGIPGSRNAKVSRWR